MKLYVLRHGESEKNKLNLVNYIPGAGYGLTEKGKRQAMDARGNLVGKNLQVIFCSELERAQETAQIINEAFDLDIRLDPRLNEINNGIFEGEKEEDYRSYISNDRIHNTPPEGETFRQLVDRIQLFIDNVKKENYESVLVVSHGAPVRMFVGILRGLALENYLDHLPGYSEVLEFEL
ncbi:histidine phosphatase family protein [Candidatus Woesearchaeota archaeon]|nr:histidine phosphatase family protein [Candidatus Woesearchaeota archaeon]